MKNKILILLLLLFGSSRVGYSQVFFNYTGGSQNYVVPAGVTVICFTVEGAQGNGNASNLMLGGLGGRTTGQLLVTPGQVLQINVGGGGLGNSTPGGFNGGAAGGITQGNCCPVADGGGGGGASDIRVNPYALANRVTVAGGGGGTGGNRSVGCSPGCGGGGGGGYYGGGGGGAYGGSPGFGGSQVAGGAGGPSCCGCPNAPTPGAAGALGVGGIGGNVGCNNQAANNPGCAGGIGGALIGGQGPNCTGGTGCPSTWAGASGAGGSNFNSGAIIGPTSVGGVRAGAGRVILIPNCCTQPTVVPVANPNAICAGQIATLTATGAGTGGTYTWNPGPITGSMVTVSPAATTIYTVTGQNTLNCTGTATVQLTVNPSPTPIPNSNSPVCTGGNINLTVNAHTSYTWTGPNAFSSNLQNPTIANASTLQAGSYTVKVTGAGGCTAQAVVVVIVNPTPTITVNNTGPYCAGQSINLSVTASNTYTWTGPLAFSSNAQNPTIANSTTNMAGPYVVTVTAVGGCVSTGTTNVIVNPAPAVTATSNGPVCIGKQINLFANPASSSYTWTGPNAFTSNAQNPTIPNAQLVNGGMYIVTVMNASGCTNTAAVVVAINPLPIVTVTGATTCVGSTFNLTAITGTAFAWTGPNSFNTPVQNPSFANAQLTHSGNYTVVVTSAQGCTNSAVANVSVIANPTANIVGSNTLCSQNFNASTNTTTLTASGGGSYVWTLPPGFSALPNLSSNPITLNPPITSTSLVATMTVVATAGSCTSQAVYQVTVYPNPTITVNSASMCVGTQVTLTANNSTTYTWSPAANLSTTNGPVVIANPANTTVYTVIGSSVGCNSQSQNANVTVVANPTVTINPNPALICLGSSINLTAIGATNYTWSPSTALTTTNTANTTANPPVTTTYSVIGSQATCTNLATIQVSVIGLPTVAVVGTNTLCSQNFNGSPSTTTLTAGGASTYQWSLPVGFSALPNLSSNPITLTPPVTSTSLVATMTVVGTAGSCTSVAVYQVTVYPNPTIAVTSASMCAGTQVTLTASNATSYTWSPATALSATVGSNVIANPSVTTMYSIIGSSVGCNSQTQNGTASVVPNPTVTINPNPSLICLGSSVNLAATGATNYTWSPSTALTTTNTANTTASPTITTTYSVIGSQATCTNLATVQVSVIGLPTVAVVGTNTLCSQNFNGSPNTTTLTANGAGTYVWTLPPGFSGSPSLNSNPLVITPPVTSVPIVATMTVLGTAGTCTNQAVYTITVVPNPTIAATSGSMCAGTQVTLTASNATTYTWTPSATLNTPNGPSVIASPTVTTVYSIIGGSVGCNSQTQNATASVVPNPTVTINPNPALICLNSSINLTASGATTYTWIPSTALTSTNTANTTASPTITTTYSIIGSQATCTNLATVQVSVIGLPTVAVVGTNTLCSQNFNGSPNTTTLTANGAGTYVWTLPPGFSGSPSLSSNPLVINPPVTSVPIVATMTVLGTAGTCTNQAVYTITVVPNPTIATTSGSMCAGTSVNLTASNATTYTWTPSATLNTSNGPNVIASPAVTTVYSIIGGSVGCNSQTQNATASVVPNPTVTILPNPAVICLNQAINLTASGATNYTWSPNVALTTTNGANTTANPTVTTVYQVIGEAATCTHVANITVSVLPLPTITIVPSSPTLCMNNFNGSPNSVSLTANGAASYTWGPIIGLTTNTLNGSTIIGTSNGSNAPTGTVIGANGTCTNSATFTLNVINNPIIATTSGSMCAGTSVSLTAANAQTYTWSPSATLNTANGPVVIASPTVTTVYSVIGSSAGCQGQTQNAIATVVANPTVSIAPTTPTICFGNSINLTANGATNYTWSPNIAITSTVGNVVTVNPTVTTTYQLIGEAATCTHVTLQTVTVVPLPVITIGLSNGSMCMNNFNGSNNQITVTASGATTYNWLGFTGIGNNTNTGPNVIVTAIPNSPMGTGTVVGTVGTCTNVATFTVIAIPNPVVAVTSASMCLGTSATLNASGATTYVWSPANTLNQSTGSSVIANPGVTTVYSVIGTSLNCNSTTQTATVDVVPNPVIVIAPGTPTICAGSAIGLTAFGATNYTWSPAVSINTLNGNFVIVTPTVTMNYVVVGEAATCTSVAVRQVSVIQLPDLQAVSSNTNICIGDKVNLIGNGATSYTWMPTTGLSSGTGNLVVATPNSNITYTLVGNNGVCTTSVTISIGVSPRPVLNLSTTSRKICKGQSSMIIVSGCQGYLWHPTSDSTILASNTTTNTTSMVVTPTANMNYTITGFNSSGPSACPFTKEILVEVVPTITPGVSYSAAVCEGKSVKLQAEGSNTYQWTPGEGVSNPLSSSPYVTPKVTTVYTVRVSDGGFCAQTATVLVKVSPQPTVNAGPDMVFNSDEPMFLNAKGTGTITWTFGDNIVCHVCPNSQITATRSGVYYATTTNEFGCTATDDVWIEVTNDYPIFIPNSFTPNFDELNEKFLVYGEGIIEFEMNIYNRWNQKIFVSNDQLTGWDGTFKGELVKNDSYLYIINYTTYDNKKRQKIGYVVVLKEDY